MSQQATASATTPDEADASSWRTLAITSVVGFMVSLEITVISLALPEIRDAFPDSTESTLSWILTSYTIGLAALLLVAGWAADRFGRKRLFLAGLTIFSLGSLIAGLAPSIETLIAARAFQSIGGAMQFPSGLALLLHAFPADRRQFAIGIWGGVGGLAAAVGPPLGGFLVGAFGWPSVFLVNVPISAITIVAGIAWLAESRNEDSPAKVDLISIPLGTIGVGAMVLGIVKGPDWGWASAPIFTTFGVGIALVLLFLVRSRRHPQPLFDLGLFKNRSYALGNIGSIMFVIAFFAYFVPLPSFIQQAWEWDVTKAGLVLIPGPAVAAIMSPISGRLADRFGVTKVLTAGGLFGIVSMVMHLIVVTETPNAWTLIIPGLFLGAAAGCSFAMLVSATMQDVEPAQFGMAGAGRTTVFQLSLAISIAVAVAIVGRPDGVADHLEAIRMVWIVALGMFVGQAVIFGLLFTRPKSKP